MGIDFDSLQQAVQRHGVVHRIVVADLRGSAPREVGAAMLVWTDGQSGTIGGGALEYAAVAAARRGSTGLSQHPLGPALGQCCGGAVALLTERFDATCLPETQEVFARPVSRKPQEEPPLSVRRTLATARNGARPVASQLVDGWMIEPRSIPQRDIWIWGAGHVGRALTDVLTPLPDCAITWVDIAADRFPQNGSDAQTRIPTREPAALVSHAPTHAEHLIVTYSHALDLELCHQLLMHQFRFAGLIGSATKWARFRSRLTSLGHSGQQINRITCPIGSPGLGKHPQQIAIGVAASLLHPAEAAAIHDNQKDLSA